jgi:transcriptional regulator with GAF, ATPase, and Fis domain
MVDENEFFRSVTLRLCSHLEIEEGLRDCIEYISRYIPADSIYLEKHEPSLNAMRVIASATVTDCKMMDLLIPFTPEAGAAMEEIQKARMASEFPPVVVINNPREDPLTSSLLVALGEPSSSVLGLPLLVEGQMAGGLVLLAEGEDRFDDHHSRLYETLREPFFVAVSNTLKHQEVVKLKNVLAEDNRFLSRELLHITGDQVIGADFGLRTVMHQVQHVASTESPVLLTGETGAGKDVIANVIHLGSPRRDGPFIPVNCGAIPDSLLDSELFGHEKGAFTGALSQKRGRFERANKGTILLDEIGEMPLEAQVRLLRVLQHREIERVGGTERIPVDIRIIAATNQDLGAMVQSGRFREDLYFRLNVFPITVPPLRERNSDIPALVQHFIERKARELKLGYIPELAPGAIDNLMAYNWPGNVRELENVIERAIIVHHDEPLRFDDLDTSFTGRVPAIDLERDEQSLDLDTVVAGHIKRVLGKTGGKIHGPGGAGELLNINPNTLRYKMRKLGIPFGKNSTKS